MEGGRIGKTQERLDRSDKAEEDASRGRMLLGLRMGGGFTVRASKIHFALSLTNAGEGYFSSSSMSLNDAPTVTPSFGG
jgi:hypothetical protein